MRNFAPYLSLKMLKKRAINIIIIIIIIIITPFIQSLQFFLHYGISCATRFYKRYDRLPTFWAKSILGRQSIVGGPSPRNPERCRFLRQILILRKEQEL